MNSIEVKNLTKIFNPKSKKVVTALNNFSLNVPKGSIYGLLGPNGAGKTTLIKILLGITYKTSGEAQILNESVFNYKVKKRVGYLPENHRYPNYLTGEQVLEFYAKLGGYRKDNLEQRIKELLNKVKMEKWRKTKIKSYSKGMMQRLGLAQALITNPELIFLDEPTDGVDPIGRKEIRDILFDLKQEGKTIFLNSHLLSEVERVTDRVAILNKGALLKEGTVKELTSSEKIFAIEIEKEDNKHFDFTSADEQIKLLKMEDNKFIFSLPNSSALNFIIDKLRAEQLLIKSVVPQKNSLEEMFISLINETEK